MRVKFKILGRNVDGEEKTVLDGDGETSKPSWNKNLKEKRKTQIKDNHKENLLFVELVKRKKEKAIILDELISLFGSSDLKNYFNIIE